MAIRVWNGSALKTPTQIFIKDTGANTIWAANYLVVKETDGSLTTAWDAIYTTSRSTTTTASTTTSANTTTTYDTDTSASTDKNTATSKSTTTSWSTSQSTATSYTTTWTTTGTTTQGLSLIHI